MNLSSVSILLPVAVFLILCRAFLHRGDSSRTALLRAAILSVTILITITELLSIPYLLTRTGLVVAWSIALFGAIGFLIKTRKVRQMPPGLSQVPAESTIHLPANLSLTDIALATVIAAILAVIGLIAIVVPPNSWDVMEHHLPRILFWVSNHTLRPFPTPDYTQIVLGTGAESITLNTYLLWGSDRFANLVEFFSFVGCAIAASLIAGRFGAQRTGQLLAALFVVTIPEALLESSGSMTTGVVAFFTATACCFILRAGADPNLWDIVTAALATGLALLTKGMTFVYLPFLLIGCMAFRPPAVRMWMFKRLPVFIALVLAINAGQFVRACQITGTPFDAPFPAGGPRLAFGSTHYSPAAIAANVLRQTALQMGTPSSSLNARTESIVRKAISLLGQNPDDPDASWSGIPFYIDHAARLETQAGNTAHFAIVLLCFVALIFIKLKLKDRRVLWFSVSIVLAFIAYCATIRWQPWGSRFHLPLFVVAAALVGAAAERLLTRRWLLVGFSALLLIVALPYLLTNSTRSVLHINGYPTLFQPREVLYFGDQHTWWAPETLALARAIRSSGCSRIALDAYLPVPEPQIGMSAKSFYVYPLLAQFGIDGRSHFVHYINVQNPTKNFAPAKAAAPDCAVVCLSCRLSNGTKSDASMGDAHTFGDNELIFPPTLP